MTAKEKALGLCQQFGHTTMFTGDNYGVPLSLENAKKCAIIAVDEIIKAIEFTSSNIILSGPSQINVGLVLSYWDTVKWEIEKL